MSGVGGSPELLDRLATGLGRQAAGHGDASAMLRHAVAATPRASIAGPVALDLLVDTARGLDDLQRHFDELAGFVRRVAESLRAADRTLGDAVGPAGSQTGTPEAISPRASATSDAAPSTLGRRELGDLAGSAEWRGYERGMRRTVSGAIDDPFHPSRSHTVVHTDGSVQDGFTDMRRGVTIASFPAASWASGAGRRAMWGSGAGAVRGEIFGGTRATAGAAVAYGNGQVQIAADASAMLGGSASAVARAGNEYAAIEGSVTVFGGARADGNVTVGFGKSGVDAELSGRVFAGGEIEGNVSAEVLGVRGSANGSVMYGVGAEVTGDVEIGLDKIGFSFDVGLAFGLGLSGGFDVSVNPREVAAKSVEVVAAPIKGARSLWNKLT